MASKAKRFLQSRRGQSNPEIRTDGGGSGSASASGSEDNGGDLRPAAIKETSPSRLKAPSKGKKDGSASPVIRRISAFIRASTRGGRAAAKKQKASATYTPATVPGMGEGHMFVKVELSQPTWCDVCDEIMWGLDGRAMRCELCHCITHGPCQMKVTIDCPGRRHVTKRHEAAADRAIASAAMAVGAAAAAPGSKKSIAAGIMPHAADKRQVPQTGVHGLLAFLEPEQVRKRIDEYNAKTSELKLEILEDDPKNFKGYIRVSMNLARPIRVSSPDDAFYQLSPLTTSENGSLAPPGVQHGTNGSTGSGSSGSGGGSMGSRPLGHSRNSSTSSFRGDSCFYLPENVSKGLFLTASTSASEVISILLKKFKIVSNPRKFALFEKSQSDGSMRRLRRYEEPLVLQLLWGGANKDMSFVLRENSEEGEMNWEEFSRPELETFLRILEKEEEQHLASIIKRYEAKQAKYEEAIAQCTNHEEGGGYEGTDEDVVRMCEHVELLEATASAEAAIDELDIADADAAIEELEHAS